MPKSTLWLLVAYAGRADLPYVIPTLAWMARGARVEFEAYLECPRTGQLFAETGSTILGGHHHQQFNYLCAACDVHLIRLGATAVFDSSAAAFRLEPLFSGESAAALYAALLERFPALAPQAIVLGPSAPLRVREQPVRLAPYLFPEILYSRALGFAVDDAGAAAGFLGRFPRTARRSVFLSDAEHAQARRAIPRLVRHDRVGARDDWGRLALRIARRWLASAKGVVFGDPPAILSQLAAHCRHDRVAVYAPAAELPAGRVRTSHYAEAASPIADEVAALARTIGNPVITGRQTGDGDLFAWSRQGVCIQIIDPNRPAFPIVEVVSHPWAKPAPPSAADAEPDDAQLARWADEGKIAATLLWHSGEVAHNEAMLALIELAGWTGLKMGVGVHAQRYETCPQLWELLAVPRASGGARGLVEPLLHSGGLGVLAECHCPPAALARHCREAMRRIRAIAGDAAPRGYYAFMDSDLATLSRRRPGIYRAVEDAGLEYFVSSFQPGRNRIVHRSPRLIALNQSCRVVHAASPFVRITTREDLDTASRTSPGWLVATLDSPVIAFTPYLWRHGSRFMAIFYELTTNPHLVNVTPRTVARYARLLAGRGLVPDASARES